MLFVISFSSVCISKDVPLTLFSIASMFQCRTSKTTLLAQGSTIQDSGCASQVMKTAKAIIIVAMCLLVARMASGATYSPEPSTIGEPGPYPAAAETPRYAHYEHYVYPMNVPVKSLSSFYVPLKHFVHEVPRCSPEQRALVGIPANISACRISRVLCIFSLHCADACVSTKRLLLHSCMKMMLMGVFFCTIIRRSSLYLETAFRRMRKHTCQRLEKDLTLDGHALIDENTCWTRSTV